MHRVHFPEPDHPNKDAPDERDPGAPPVEPDQGPTPGPFPDDLEHPRVIDPPAGQDQTHHQLRLQVEAAA
jgi:hypothetical protein